MKSKNGALATIVVCVLIGFLPIPEIVKLILIIAISAVLIYINRSMFYFIQGNRNYMSKKPGKKEKTWPYYRKAYEANLNDKHKVTMASILIQRNDYKFGGEILESVINNSKDKQLINRSKIQMSMVYQLDGEIDKAVEILVEVKESGYNDKNLMINLGTYLLYQNDLERSKDLIEECIDEEKTSSGILDNHGWYHILNGNYEEAYRIYLDILERKPRFPDPYVHAAQVYLHYNNVDKAIDCLKQSLKKIWTNTIIFDKEIIKQMIEKLESEKANYYVACINNSTEAVAKGDLYQELSETESNKYLSKEFDKEPTHLIEEAKSETDLDNDTESSNEENMNKQIKSNSVDDDFPNTELTDDDLKWEEEHK